MAYETSVKPVRLEFKTTDLQQQVAGGFLIAILLL